MTVMTSRRANGRARRLRVGPIVATVLIALFATLAISPVATVLIGSLKSAEQITTDPLGLPSPIEFSNYLRGWDGVSAGKPMWVYLVNTGVFSGVAVLVSTVLGTMTAYALSRWHSRFSAIGQRYYLVLYALPFLATIIPLYSLTGAIGLRSNLAGIAVVFAASWIPLTVILMFAFFSSFPLDVIESAKTDGAGEIQIFLRIVLPMSKSAVLANVLLAFIHAWNNLSHTLPLLVDPASTTVAPGLLLFNTTYSVDQGAQFAGMFMSAVPLVLAYLLLHRHIMESFRVGSFR